MPTYQLGMLTGKLLRKNKFFIGALAVVVVVSGIIAVVWNRSNNFGNKYAIVYLTSGEIYVGHFYTFPIPTLEGAYLLQNVKSASDQTKTDLQLFPLSQAAWAPTKLYVNWKQVIYYGPLDENSVAAKSLKNKSQ